MHSRNLLSLVLLIFFLSHTVCAQHLIPYRKGKLWGYADSNGVIVIEPAYDQTSLSDCDIMAIKLNNQWGVINRQGEIVIPFGSYDHIDRNCDERRGGTITIRDSHSKKTMIFSHEGKHLADVDALGNADQWQNDSGPNLLVYKNGYGVISNQGEWIIKPQSTEIKMATGGYFAISTDSTRFYDPRGKILSTIERPDRDFQFVGRYACFYYVKNDLRRLAKIKDKDLVQVLDRKTMTYRKETREEAITYTINCMVDRNGKNYLPKGFKTDWCGIQKGAYIPVTGPSGQGIIDTNGKFLVPPTYGWIEPLDGYIRLNHGGFVTLKTWRIVKPAWDYVVEFNGIVYVVRKGNECNLVDTTGKQLYREGFEFVMQGYKKTFVAKRKGIFYLMDESGKTIIELDSLNYESALPFQGNLAVVRRHGKAGLIDRSGKEVQPTIYKKIDFDERGYYHAQAENGHGILSEGDGKLVVDTTYEEVVALTPNKRYVIVNKNHRCGLYDLKRKEILPLVYTKIQPNMQGYYALEQPNPEFVKVNGPESVDAYGVPRGKYETNILPYLYYVTDPNCKVITSTQGFFIWPYNFAQFSKDGFIRFDGLKFYED